MGSTPNTVLPNPRSTCCLQQWPTLSCSAPGPGSSSGPWHHGQLKIHLGWKNAEDGRGTARTQAPTFAQHLIQPHVCLEEPRTDGARSYRSAERRAPKRGYWNLCRSYMPSSPPERGSSKYRERSPSVYFGAYRSLLHLLSWSLCSLNGLRSSHARSSIHRSVHDWTRFPRLVLGVLHASLLAVGKYPVMGPC